MIRFRCHRCKRPIAAPDGYVGKKVKCPGCMIVTIVPDIPGAAAAKARVRPESKPAPPPAAPQPRDPLDELAAAVDGDVETASFDEEYPDAPAYEAPSTSRHEGRRRTRKPRQQSQDTLLLWIIVSALAIGVIVALVMVLQRGS